MSGNIIVGIDNLSLLLLILLIVAEIYGFVVGNDIILLIGFVATVLVYVIRIRNRRNLNGAVVKKAEG